MPNIEDLIDELSPREKTLAVQTVVFLGKGGYDTPSKYILLSDIEKDMNARNDVFLLDKLGQADVVWSIVEDRPGYKPGRTYGIGPKAREFVERCQRIVGENLGLFSYLLNLQR